MIRVLIVAPTPALRAGLRALLTAANVEIIDAIGSLVDLSGIAADIDVILAADESVLADADQVLAEEPRYAAL
ncbi:MAG: DNA-binding response regulator, partial [Roseiflexus sp.]